MGRVGGSANHLQQLLLRLCLAELNDKFDVNYKDGVLPTDMVRRTGQITPLCQKIKLKCQ